MHSLLKTRILSALSAPLLLMGAATTAAECENVAPEPLNPSLSANAGDQATVIETATLAFDSDGDVLTPGLAISPLIGTAGGTLELSTIPSGLRYTAPLTLNATADDIFEYTVADNHGGSTVDAKLTITVSATPAPLPCDPVTGGTACFGQTWDGRWFTLQQELAGAVKSADGTRLALFVPSKAEYLKPDKAKGKIIAIFPNPGGGYESFWGCGPAQSVVGPSRYTCDFGQSLRGDVTYMYRLPVINGKIYRTTVQASSSGMSDQYGSWFFALSMTPNTTITFDGTTPSGEPAGCMGWGSSMTINQYTCPYLISRTAPPAPALAMRYFKIQAAPAKTYVAGQWSGTPSSECAKSLRCRMYLSSW